MPKKGANISLSSYDDIFETDESRADSQLEKVQKIPINELVPFKNHPFKVVDDEAMLRTTESIAQFGVLTPLIARPLENGGYEIISGHRRAHAAEAAGFTEVPVIVRDMDDDAATVLMVDSNLQREQILPSERAFAYKMKLEAMKHQGERTDLQGELTSRQVGEKLQAQTSVGEMSDQIGESQRQIQRFIRLTNLIPELLDMVDQKQISFNPAVELSYLTQEEQESVLDQIYNFECMPSHAQTIRMRKLSQRGELDDRTVIKIMKEEKPNQADRIRIPYNEIRQYIPRSVSYEKTADYIKTALKFYQEHHSKNQS